MTHTSAAVLIAALPNCEDILEAITAASQFTEDEPVTVEAFPDEFATLLSELTAALLAARRENETAWLIEVPQSGGAVWWTGQEDSDGNLPDSSRLAWLKFFSADANKAVRFRSEADAQAVLRLLPQSWKLWTYPAVVTDHRWCSGPDLAALAATPEGKTNA